MAGEERDARLILQAEDRASKTFAEVSKAIKEVRKNLVDQSAAAKAGEGDLNAINTSLKTLRDLGKQLVQEQSVLNAFEKQGAAVTAAKAKLDAARASLEAYEVELAKSGSVSDTQQRKLERLGTSVERAQGQYDRASTTFGTISERMERAGLVAGKFEQQTTAIANAAREAAQGIAQATSAVDGFGAASDAASAAKAASAKGAQLNAAVAASPLSAADIAFVTQFDNAIDRLRESEAELARVQAVVTAQTNAERAARDAALKDVLSGNAQLEASFAELARAEAEAAAVNAFKKIGTDAAAAADNIDRFANGGAADVELLANAVRRLANPFNEVVSTVKGAAGAIDQAFAVADSSKGPDKLNAYSQAMGQLVEAQRALLGQAGLIDDFRAQEQAVAAADRKFAEHRAEVQRLSAAIAAADAPNSELVAETKRAQAAMDSAGVAAANEATKLKGLSTALQKAGIDSKNLANAEKEIISASTKAGEAADKLKSKQDGKGGFLGLNPYEVQNLGFQINDVFTQLASGTPITQVIAQQGGQILQLFRGAIPFLLQWGVLILALAAPLIAIGSAIARTVAQADALRTFTGLFQTLGDGANYSAQQFADASIKLQDMGLKADEANKLLTKFATEGLNPAGLEGFIGTAKNLGEVIGIDTAAAFDLLSRAAQGGYDQILALNEATGIYTATELEHIKALFDNGKAEEARAEAMSIAQRQADKGIAQLDGPFDRALRLGKVGWTNITEALQGFSKSNYSYLFPAVRGAIIILSNLSTYIENAAIGFAYLTGRIKGLSDEQARAQAQSSLSRKSGGNAGAAAAANEQAGIKFLDQQNQELRGAKLLTREQRLSAAATKARADAAAVGATNAQIELAARNAQRIEQNKIDKEGAAAGRKAASAARSAESKAEAAANRLLSAQQAAENALASMNATVGRLKTQTLAERLGAVDEQYAKIFAQIDAVDRAGGSKARTDEMRAQVQQNVVLLKQAAEQAYYEDQIKNLTKERSDALARIREQFASGEITAADAINRAKTINDQLAPGIAKAATDALVFAKAIQAANPSPAMAAFISSLEKTLGENSGGGLGKSLRELTDQTISTQAGRINDILSQRNDLVSAEQALVEAGVRTRRDAQTNIEAGYARTQPLLDAQVQSMRDLLATLDLTDPSMQLLYDTWSAKLDGIVAKQGYVSATFTQLKTGIDGAITQNALQGFDTIAKSLGALITGGQSVGDTFAQIGQAALQFVAQTIGAIARLIIQMLILDAIQKATGIPVAALAGAMNGGGGGGGGGIFGQLGSLFGSIFHEGSKGTVGNAVTRGRRLPASTWIGAPRYHEGYTPGLKTGEVAAIIKKSEEVITDEDPRHVNNGGLGLGGGGGGQGPGLRQVLAFGDDEIAGAMSGPAGESVTITHLRRNKTLLKQLVS